MRYNGEHAYDAFLANTLSQYVDWISICPEAEAGLGTPRDPMHLIGTPSAPRLLTIATHIDHTHTMTQFSHQRITARDVQALAGYVFKSKSPSCGIEHIPIATEPGDATSTGMGIFSGTFKAKHPLMPIADERGLHHRSTRMHFLEQVYCYHRWNKCMDDHLTQEAIIGFHTRHKYLLLAHSPEHYHRLGHLVATMHQHDLTRLAHEYGKGLMDAIKRTPTIRTHVNVLYHMMGYLTDQLDTHERTTLHDMIHSYHRGALPLREPLQHIRRYAHARSINYLCIQTYLNPYPDALMSESSTTQQ